MFRRVPRLSTGLCAGVGTGLLIAAWTAVPQATAAPVADEPAVRMTIDSFLPVAPKPGDTVKIAGTITNTGTVALSNPQALACIDHKRMDSRADLATLPPDGGACDGWDDSTARQAFEGPLAPQASARFTLSVPWDEWKISKKAGVYVVGAYLRADLADGQRDTVGKARTLMPVVPASTTMRKVDTAMVVPLRFRPTQLGGDQFSSGALAAALGPQGKLGRQLQSGIAKPVTWLADPGVIDDAKRIATGYQIRAAGNSTSPGPDSQNATAWLKKFDEARKQDSVVLLPYGDPDVDSLIGNGLTSLVSKSREKTSFFRFDGGTAPRSGLWLETGSANDRNLAKGSAGFPTQPSNIALVPSWSWPVEDRPVLTPKPFFNVSTPSGPGKTAKTVVADSALVAGGPDAATATSPIQVRQRFAAETALLSLTAPTGPVSAVALPSRSFDSDGRGTQVLLQGLDLPWINAVTLDQITTGQPRATAAPSMPRTTPGLNESQLRQIRQFDRQLQVYGALVTNPAPAVEPLRFQLLRAGSTAWRGRLVEAQRYLSFQVGTVNNQVNRVHLVRPPKARQIKVTLSGSKGTFPLSVVNELGQSAKVGLKVFSVNRSDLKIAPSNVITLLPRGKGTFHVQATAQQNGYIQAKVQVVTAAGEPVGPPQDIVIEAAQYGNVGWALVAASVALLFGVSLIRIYRRIRKERRDRGTPPPDDAKPVEPTPAPAPAPADDAKTVTPEAPTTEPVTANETPAVNVVPAEVKHPNDVPADSEAPETVREGAGRTDG
ncbi:hypothetical protein [Kribbella deserti]|uniref:Uncharacterized protein n=1 Tax=Kribbella deserti TaxID=1926257 RepID=A0ABV6QK12_9ACTN